MNTLIFLFLLALPAISFAAATPQLLVSAGKTGWTNPVISRDGSKLAFSNASHSEIRVLVIGEDSSRQVVLNAGVGRRFVFEPGDQERVTYRRRIAALPEQPERLLSVSLYMLDPVSRTQNVRGDLFGPYLIGNQIYYRDSLTAPLISLAGKARKDGPYWNTTTGQLMVKDPNGKAVYTSDPTERFGAMEISPDGNWVAAAQTEPSRALLVIRVSDGKVIKENNAADPGWAGNSMSLVCVRQEGSNPPELYRLRLPKGTGDVLFSSPKFSPETPVLNVDGSRAVFVSQGSIYSVDALP
ncbi:MAG TPA: hypothetical protein VGL38_05275 [bacterium]|jgi:hypothetical protein